MDNLSVLLSVIVMTVLRATAGIFRGVNSQVLLTLLEVECSNSPGSSAVKTLLYSSGSLQDFCPRWKEDRIVA